MKKILLTTLIALTLITSASARNFKTLSFGAKAGVNLSTVSGIADKVGQMKPFFTGGLHFEFRPIKMVGLGAELLYAGGGFQTGPLNDNGTTINTSYHFIDIPVMARIYAIGGLSINLGVQFSYMFSPTLNIGELRSQFGEDKVAFSIPIGLSYTFGFGLIIDARYSFALNDILPTYYYTDSRGQAQQLPQLKRQAVALTVGWRILGI